jgi:nucleoside-diphosphate-sugar epimerase
VTRASERPEQLAGRRVLVTGATGFIGARLCERAAELGAEVFGVSRRRRAVGPSTLHWECADLTDIAAVRALARRVEPDIVLHLASEVSGDRSADLVLPMLRSNLLAAVNVMLASRETSCDRVVLAGSMEEPDFGDADAIAQSPYAAAKWAAHGYARLFHAIYDLSVVHLRIFMVYGPGQGDLRKLIPYVATSLLSGETPALTSGEREVDWVYVDDVVDAFVAAAVAPGVDGVSLDIGSGELVTVRDIASRITRLVGGRVEPEFGAVPARKLERVRVADPAIAAAAIGWRPQTSLDEGLARTVDFYRDARAPRGSA